MWQFAWDGSNWHDQAVGGAVSHGGILASDPSCVSWGPDRIDCFFRGSDNAMWQFAWDGSVWHDLAVGGALSLSALFAGDPTCVSPLLTCTPDCASASSDRIDCFFRSSDNGTCIFLWDGSEWSGWSRHEIPIVAGDFSCMPVETGGADRVDCYVRGTDNGLWHTSWGHDWEGIPMAPIPEFPSFIAPTVATFAILLLLLRRARKNPPAASSKD